MIITVIKVSANRRTLSNQSVQHQPQAWAASWFPMVPQQLGARGAHWGEQGAVLLLAGNRVKAAAVSSSRCSHTGTALMTYRSSKYRLYGPKRTPTSLTPRLVPSHGSHGSGSVRPISWAADRSTLQAIILFRLNVRMLPRWKKHLTLKC